MSTCLRQDADAKYVTDESLDAVLDAGLESALCETVNVKPGLCWKTKDVGDSSVMKYLPRKASNIQWVLPKRKKCAAVIKAGLAVQSNPFDLRQCTSQFSVNFTKANSAENIKPQ